MVMQKKMLQFRSNFLLWAIILNIFVAYILKYRSITGQSVTLGYPIEWFTIYDVFKGSGIFQVSNLNLSRFAANILIYYLLIHSVYIIKVKIFKERAIK